MRHTFRRSAMTPASVDTKSTTSSRRRSSMSLTSISRCASLGTLLTAFGEMSHLPTVPTASSAPRLLTFSSKASASSAAASDASFLYGAHCHVGPSTGAGSWLQLRVDGATAQI